MSATQFGLSVKAIILDDQNRCLLIRRSAHNKSFVGQWEWPGGKVDAGEDFIDAVSREAREETALEVEATAFAGALQFSMPTLTVVVLCFETKLTGGQFKLSDEHDDFAWVALNELGQWNLTGHTREFMLEFAGRKLTDRKLKT